MKVIRSITQIRRFTQGQDRRRKKIGLVPTMGFLHEGHLSLMRRARAECDIVISSIFVNPTQFGPREDFKKYPRDFRRDRQLAQACGVDVLFSPRPEDMYPAGSATSVCVEGLSSRLCGSFRPGHFRGVATVVMKFFHIIEPDRAYFGWKDAQQVLVIKRMVQDLNMPITIRALPTVREVDGLALSSRNTYLSRRQRDEAPVLYASLQRAKGMIQSGTKESRSIVGAMKRFIGEHSSARIQYIELVDMKELKPVSRIKKGMILIALAAFFGQTRLIDNIRIRCS
ncbi:MAG: pantoate--beta-alanine ligase [Candidatus Omnitrophica bacterium]|nr:pantoate--beta-alanine ligase [Candidatus Omnitrophota bacterium]